MQNTDLLERMTPFQMSPENTVSSKVGKSCPSVGDPGGHLLDLHHMSLPAEAYGPKLHSSLPAGLARARRLEFLFCAGRDLKGSIPAFSSTFNALVLRDNQLESVPHLRLSTSAVMLLDHNRLSCRLPADSTSQGRACLVAVGNHMTWSGSIRELPSYIMPYERDGVLWFKRDAGTWFLGKLLIGSGALTMAMLLRVGCRGYVTITQRWHASRGMNRLISNLAIASLLFMVSQVVCSCILLMMVIGYDYYICGALRCPRPHAKVAEVLAAFRNPPPCSLIKWLCNGYVVVLFTFQSTRFTTDIKEKTSWKLQTYAHSCVRIHPLARPQQVSHHKQPHRHSPLERANVESGVWFCSDMPLATFAGHFPWKTASKRHKKTWANPGQVHGENFEFASLPALGFLERARYEQAVLRPRTKGLLMVVSKRWLEFCPESKSPYPLLTSI